MARADEMPGGYAANGQALAYLGSREDEAEARQAKVLTNDEARWLAIARCQSCSGRRDGPSTRRPARRQSFRTINVALAHCRNVNRSPLGPPRPEHRRHGAISTRQPNCC
jgi:hypothetical protein